MLVYGRNTVTEALKSKFNVSSVILQENIPPEGKISEIKRLAQKKGCPIKHYNLKDLKKLTGSEEHQGVALFVSFDTVKLKDALKNNPKTFVCIPEATYEQNIGAIIRTSECAGLSGVIISPKVEITPTIAKVSTGALFHIPIIKSSVYQVIGPLKESGFRIVGIERGGTPLYKENLEGNNLYIIGGEDKSIPENLQKMCDTTVEIPQYGVINSLNMSVAASIVIFEGLRQNLETRD